MKDREKSKENPCSCFFFIFCVSRQWIYLPSLKCWVFYRGVLWDGKTREIFIGISKSRENDLLFIFTSIFQARATKSNYYLSNVVFQATITESNSLLLTQLITNDPEGNFRRPPQAVLDQLAQANQHYKIGHLLCRSRSPDFLLAILGR